MKFLLKRAVVSIAFIAVAAGIHAQQRSDSRRGARPAAAESPPDQPERHTLADEFGAHLADVRQRLKIEPAQQRAWDLYEQRVQALMLDQMRGVAVGLSQSDAPHQIDRKVDVVRNRLAAMEDIAEAARALYAQLDEDQRKRADELLVTTVPTLYSGVPDFGRDQRPGNSSRGPDRRN